ncbi:MAG: tetratricopeptide repeat protein [Candidatus Gastranaerophilales bacterium]|nr:tetratricopeptide repeat protein [Candidatus Gastranaerophilales bacterium]
MKKILAMIGFCCMLTVSPVNAQQTPDLEKLLLINESSFNNNLREMLEDTQNQLLSAQKEIENLYDKNFELKSSLQRQNQLLEELKSHKENLEKLLQEKNDYIQLQKTNSGKNLSFEILQKESEINKLKTLVEKKDNELQKLKNNTQGDFKNILAVKDSKIKVLEETLENKEFQLNKVIEQKNLELNSIKNKNLALNEENINLANKIDFLHKELISSQSNKDDLISEKYTFQRRISSLNEEKILLENKCKYLENQIKENVAMQPQNKDVIEDVIALMKEDKQFLPTFYFNIAKVYHQRKNYDKAIQNYNEVLKINSEYLNVYAQLAFAYAESGDYQNSVNTFKQYLEYVSNPAERTLIKGFISKLSDSI